MLDYGQPRPGTLMLLAFLYGVFFALFWWSMFLWYQRYRGTELASSGEHCTLKSVPLIGSIVLFIAITVHSIIQLICISLALIVQGEGAILPERQVWTITLSDGAEMALTVFITFVGDSLMVYRLWRLQKRRWLLVFPLVALTAGLACGIRATYDWTRPGYYAITGNAASDLELTLMYQSMGTGVAFSTLTAFLNMYCSGIIAWTLYKHLQNTQRKYGGLAISDVLRILIESAALYVTVAILYTVFYAVYFTPSYSDTLYGAFPETTDAIATNFAPAVGITFMLLNVRIALGYTIIPSQLPSQRTATVTTRLPLSRHAHTSFRPYFGSVDNTGSHDPGDNIELQSLGDI